MTNVDPHPSSIGRNQWDALVDTIDQLARRLGPTRLLAVIIFILVVGLLAGFGYALYVLNQDAIKSRESIIAAYKDASDTTHKMMTTANDTVTKTYKGLGEISEKQIDNLKKTIALQTELTTKLQETTRSLDEKNRTIEAKNKELAEQGKQLEERKGHLHSLQKIHRPTVATLGALGSLIDETPELLRAAATRPAVQQILQNADQLLVEVTDPEAQYPRLKILLAFADLNGFVGLAAEQERLATKALELAAALRTDGRARGGPATDEALAHLLRGNALRNQRKLTEAINETREAIRLYDVAVAAAPPSRTAKLRQRQAEAYVQLGQIMHLTRGRDAAVPELKKALAAILGQAKEEDIRDAERIQALAWIHTEIGNVELEQANPEAAEREYQTARRLMQGLGEAVHRRVEWRDRLARIYNGSAQRLVDGVTSLVREREGGRAVSPEQASAAEQNLAQALDYLDKARVITAEETARDEDNYVWQGLHAWTLRNLGMAKLSRSALVPDGADLDGSWDVLRDAEEIHDRIVRAAPANPDWKLDLIWTQMCRNEAAGMRARRDKDYAAMAQLFFKNGQLVAEALAIDDVDGWRQEQARNRASYADALALQNRQAEARQVYTEVNNMATEQAGKAERDGSKRSWQQLADRAATALRGLP